MTVVYLVHLYDCNGGYVQEALVDVNLEVPENRDYVIDSGGRIYTWRQRERQWREALGVITLGDVPEEDVA